MSDPYDSGKRKSKRDKKAKARFNVYKKGGGKRTRNVAVSNKSDKVKKKKK